MRPIPTRSVSEEPLRNPNPKRKRGTISQVPHLRIGLGLVVLTLPFALAVNLTKVRPTTGLGRFQYCHSRYALHGI